MYLPSVPDSAGTGTSVLHRQYALADTEISFRAIAGTEVPGYPLISSGQFEERTWGVVTCAHQNLFDVLSPLELAVPFRDFNLRYARSVTITDCT
eukprot:3935159-Rhodomonas_salina.4